MVVPHRFSVVAQPSIFHDMNGLRGKRGESDERVRGAISKVLMELAPKLHIDRCQIEIADFVPATGELSVRIGGSCPDCEASPAIFATAIEAHVRRRVPKVRSVRVEEIS